MSSRLLSKKGRGSGGFTLVEAVVICSLVALAVAVEKALLPPLIVVSTVALL